MVAVHRALDLAERRQGLDNILFIDTDPSVTDPNQQTIALGGILARRRLRDDTARRPKFDAIGY